VTTKPLKKGATYDDLVRVPEHFVAEMFDGDLYAWPRPAAPHARAATKFAAKLDGPFDFDGPGGWILRAFRRDDEVHVQVHPVERATFPSIRISWLGLNMLWWTEAGLLKVAVAAISSRCREICYWSDSLRRVQPKCRCR